MRATTSATAATITTVRLGWWMVAMSGSFCLPGGHTVGADGGDRCLHAEGSVERYPAGADEEQSQQPGDESDLQLCSGSRVPDGELALLVDDGDPPAGDVLLHQQDRADQDPDQRDGDQTRHQSGDQQQATDALRDGLQ